MGVGAVKEKVQPDDQERKVRQKRMRNCLSLLLKGPWCMCKEPYSSQAAVM